MSCEPESLMKKVAVPNMKKIRFDKDMEDYLWQSWLPTILKIRKANSVKSCQGYFKRGNMSESSKDFLLEMGCICSAGKQ